MMWKLMMGLFKFISEWVPRFFKKFFSFWRLLFLKAAKTGFFTAGIYMGISFGLTKYWDLLLADLGPGTSSGVPSFMVEWPALALSTWIFWTKTRFLINTQKNMLYFLLDKGKKMLKFFFTVLLGLPDDKAFSRKSMPMGKRIQYFFIYVYKNIINLMVRMAVFFLIFKAVAKYGITRLLESGMVNIRDLLLFPVIIIKLAIDQMISII